MLKLIDDLTKVDGKTVVGRALKLTEECGEVAEAVLGVVGEHGCDYKGKTTDDVLEECVDVIILASSIYCEHTKGKTIDEKEEEFKLILAKKLSKWAEKISATEVLYG